MAGSLRRILQLTLLISVLGCDTTRKLARPAGPLQRNISGTYKNYNAYSKGHNLAKNYWLEISEKNGAYRSRFRIATRQAHHSNGRAKYLEGEYLDAITSADEIIFRSKISMSCEAWRHGEFNTKMTEWKDEEFGEPRCATADELGRMNADRKDPETNGAYFRLVGDDELWLGDEDLPVKLRKVPDTHVEVVE